MVNIGKNIYRCAQNMVVIFMVAQIVGIVHHVIVYRKTVEKSTKT